MIDEVIYIWITKYFNLNKISNIDLNYWFKHEDENKFNIYDYFIINKNMIILSHLISKIKLNN